MKYVLAVVLVFVPQMVQGAAQDHLTRELDGTEITYKYSNGNSYGVKFAPEGISYRFLAGEAPEKWWGPFPYRAFKTKSGEFFAGWYEKGFGDQITLLINLEAKTLMGSGIIVRGEKVTEHFHEAEILTVQKKAR